MIIAGGDSFEDPERRLIGVMRGGNVRKKIATVAQWKASGLSQAEFCRREGLQQWQLSEWKRYVEVRERRKEEAQGQPAEASTGRSPGARKRTEAANLRTSRTERNGGVTERRPFVPVRLVDVVAEGSRDTGNTAASSFGCVLEVVLRCGRTIRVAANCEPLFLSAVVSTLDRV